MKNRHFVQSIMSLNMVVIGVFTPPKKIKLNGRNCLHPFQMKINSVKDKNPFTFTLILVRGMYMEEVF